MKKIFLFAAPWVAFLFQSCVTYYMSTASLKQQLSYMPDSITKLVADKNSVKTTLVVGKEYHKQFNNGIKKIECTDKSGKKFNLNVEHNTQIVLINKRGHGQTFYFETVKLRGDSILLGNIAKASDVFILAKLSNIDKVQILHPSTGVANKVK